MKIGSRGTVVLLLVLLWMASLLDGQAVQKRVWQQPVQPVVLYFGQSDAMGVSPEIRWFPPDMINPGDLLRALIGGPQDPRLVRSLPASTELINWQQRGNSVVIDFNRSIVTDHPGGSAGEIMTVYSIVNTLTELPGIKTVSIRIEGEEVESLVGHMDLSRPLQRSESFIVAP